MKKIIGNLAEFFGYFYFFTFIGVFLYSFWVWFTVGFWAFLLICVLSFLPYYVWTLTPSGTVFENDQNIDNPNFIKRKSTMFRNILVILLSLCLMWAIPNYLKSPAFKAAIAPSEKIYVPVTPQPKPSGQVQISSLGTRGQRIQINITDSSLSKAACRALADQYLDQAKPNGQVSIHKPDLSPPFNGAMRPFCVNNLDGRGTFFP